MVKVIKFYSMFNFAAGNLDVGQYIMHAVDDNNPKDNNGKTPLHMAARGWVPKFATGINITTKKAFIFIFLTRLDYKHKDQFISNFLKALKGVIFILRKGYMGRWMV